MLLAAVVLLAAASQASAAHVSPEYFTSSINYSFGVKVGHRHHITLVGTRHLSDVRPNQLCVGALTDNDTLVNERCAWLSNNETMSTTYAGTYWYRGWGDALYSLAHRLREVF